MATEYYTYDTQTSKCKPANDDRYKWQFTSSQACSKYDKERRDLEAMAAKYPEANWKYSHKPFNAHTNPPAMCIKTSDAVSEKLTGSKVFNTVQECEDQRLRNLNSLLVFAVQEANEVANNAGLSFKNFRGAIVSERSKMKQPNEQQRNKFTSLINEQKATITEKDLQMEQMRTDFDAQIHDMNVVATNLMNEQKKERESVALYQGKLHEEYAIRATRRMDNITYLESQRLSAEVTTLRDELQEANEAAAQAAAEAAIGIGNLEKDLERTTISYENTGQRQRSEARDKEKKYIAFVSEARELMKLVEFDRDTAQDNLEMVKTEAEREKKKDQVTIEKLREALDRQSEAQIAELERIVEDAKSRLRHNVMVVTAFQVAVVSALGFFVKYIGHTGFDEIFYAAISEPKKMKVTGFGWLPTFPNV